MDREVQNRAVEIDLVQNRKSVYRYFLNWKKALLLVAGVLLLLSVKTEVLAAEAEVTFGSEFYEETMGEEFPLGVYVNGTDKLGYYRLEISYDTEKMRYIDGGSSTRNGVIVIEGNSTENTVKHMLHFEALDAGWASISVKTAEVKATKNENEHYRVKTMASAPVTITDENGELPEGEAAPEGQSVIAGEQPDNGQEDQEDDQNVNTEGNEEQVTPEGESADGENTGSEANAAAGSAQNANSGAGAQNQGQNAGSSAEEAPKYLGEITLPGKGTYQLLNHAVYVPGEVDWQYYKEEGTCQGKKVTFLCDSQDTVRILYLKSSTGKCVPYAVSQDGTTLEACGQASYLEMEYLQIPVNAVTLPEGLTEEKIQEEGILCLLNKSGSCYFYRQSEDGHLVPWNYEAAQAPKREVKAWPMNALVAAAILILLVVGIGTLVFRNRMRKKDLEPGDVDDVFTYDDI